MTYSPYYFAQMGTGSAEAVVTPYTNASGVTAIPQGQACSANSSGLVSVLDVSNQASWQGFVGYANARIAASTKGGVIANGRLQNITTSIAVGTPLFVGKDGNPTSTTPSIGVGGFVSGDMVIFMGILVVNDTNPSAKDIALFTQLVGTL